MNLNAPPPGVGRAAEIVPAVLRVSTPARPSATSTQPRDALAAMLHGSQQWEDHPAAVSRRVTLISWLLLALDIAVIYANHALARQDHFLALIVTWGGNPQTATAVAVLAALAMVVTAAMTKGLRRANVTWLRVWAGASIASIIAIAAMFVALIIGLVMLVVGLVIGIATLAIVVFIGGVIGLGVAEGIGG